MRWHKRDADTGAVSGESIRSARERTPSAQSKRLIEEVKRRCQLGGRIADSRTKDVVKIISMNDSRNPTDVALQMKGYECRGGESAHCDVEVLVPPMSARALTQSSTRLDTLNLASRPVI